MDILLRQVRIIDPSSPFHQQQKDIFIQNGQIIEIGSINRSADQTINIEGLCVSTGWVDVFANFCDPGYEFKETLESGSRAAASGGFTDVFVIPNTNPVIHHKSSVEYIVRSSRSLEVSIHPIAAITKNTEGKELSEMYDMGQSGAVAYSDGIEPVQSSGLLLKALQYIKTINKTIIQLPDDRSISSTGLVNEGIVSTRLGLPGKPSIAEELIISRDIELADYTGSRIHFTGITTRKSLELIGNAKRKGIQVTCSVTPAHLYFTDEDLKEYDTNLKINPPIRSKEDVLALKAGVLNGDIDCIASHHMPQDTDHKMVEFEYALYGMTSLETLYALVKEAIPELSEEQTVKLLSTNARKIFSLENAMIENGKRASLTLFHPNLKWKKERNHSKSGNTPFNGKSFNSKAVGIINKDRLFLND